MQTDVGVQWLLPPKAALPPEPQFLARPRAGSVQGMEGGEAGGPEEDEGLSALQQGDPFPLTLGSPSASSSPGL